jgi:hypothetical protein
MIWTCYTSGVLTSAHAKSYVEQVLQGTFRTENLLDVYEKL